jgi:hypothetical protein
VTEVQAVLDVVSDQDAWTVNGELGKQPEKVGAVEDDEIEV